MGISSTTAYLNAWWNFPPLDATLRRALQRRASTISHRILKSHFVFGQHDDSNFDRSSASYAITIINRSVGSGKTAGE
ncbi:hypothetical protein TNCV_3458901 [Trichonephila clavipes]|nr:hypothetical protein TNCV_3458901 [Trichonephila clavipes]